MRETLLDALTQLKTTVIQTGSAVKHAVVGVAADTKTGAVVAAGTTAGGVWTSNDTVTYAGLILSSCLIAKHLLDIRKLLLEMTIMRVKEAERINKNSPEDH